jgi:hypothetical protein
VKYGVKFSFFRSGGFVSMGSNLSLFFTNGGFPGMRLRLPVCEIPGQIFKQAITPRGKSGELYFKTVGSNFPGETYTSSKVS